MVEPNADRAAAEKRARDKLGFFGHALVYVVVMTVLVLINLESSSESYWFIWPMLGWGIGVLWHGLGVFVFTRESRVFQRMVEREMRH